MGNIQKLSDELIDQIAAGEVVDRPASVVKELVENAIDAHAKHIHIELDHGGLGRILVQDDGDGMAEDDALLALERHATSKLKAFTDLHSLHTFGFRGEALPSIASVSVFTLRTRQNDRDVGVEIKVLGGRHSEPRPVGCAVGTQMEVRDLFYNVPARRKFLKSTATESMHVAEEVMSAALSKPELQLSLQKDGKVTHRYLSEGSRKTRVLDVLSEKNVHFYAFSEKRIQVEAYLAPLERARKGTSGLHLFVNGRAVTDRTIAKAITHAYGDELESGSYPLGVIYIDMPHDQVDINVHPRKAEVRFVHGRELFEIVSNGLRASLDRSKRVLFETTQKALNYEKKIVALSPHFSPQSLSDGWPAPKLQNMEPGHEFAQEPRNKPSLLGKRGKTQVPFSPDVKPEVEFVGYGRSTLGSRKNLFSNQAFYSLCRVLGKIESGLVLCEGPDAIYFFDPHSCYERFFCQTLSELDACAEATKKAGEFSPVAFRELLEKLDGCNFEKKCIHSRMVVMRVSKSDLAFSNVDHIEEK